MADKHTSVEGYLASYDDERRARLEELRSLIHARIPGSAEKISYQIPTVTLDGAAVLYFAGWKHHMALYPVPRGDEAFEREVAPLRAAKDAVHLRYDQPLPVAVVERIVALLVERATPAPG